MYSFLLTLISFYKHNYITANEFFLDNRLKSLEWERKTKKFLKIQNLKIEKYISKNYKYKKLNDKKIVLKIISQILQRNYFLRSFAKYNLGKTVFIIFSLLHEFKFVLRSILSLIFKKNKNLTLNLNSKKLFNKKVIIAYEFPIIAFNYKKNNNYNFSNSYFEFIKKNFKNYELISFNSYHKSRMKKTGSHNYFVLTPKNNLNTFFKSFFDFILIPKLLFFDKKLNSISNSFLIKIYILIEYYNFLIIKNSIKFFEKKNINISEVHTLQYKNFHLFDKNYKVNFKQFIYSENFFLFNYDLNIKTNDYKSLIKPQTWSLGSNPINLTQTVNKINLYKNKLLNNKNFFYEKNYKSLKQKSFLGFSKIQKKIPRQNYILIFDNVSDIGDLRIHSNPYSNPLRSTHFNKCFLEDILSLPINEEIIFMIKPKYNNHDNFNYKKIINKFSEKKIEIIKGNSCISDLIKPKKCKFIISAPFVSAGKIINTKKNNFYYFPDKYKFYKRFNKTHQNFIYGFNNLHIYINKNI